MFCRFGLAHYFLSQKHPSVYACGRGRVGLPEFLLQFSCAIALFNLLPIPPLDGGHLVLIAFEKLRGRAASSEKQLIRPGNWVVAVVTIVTSVLLLPRIVSGVGSLF
jgi:regulator of sigma E protease